MSLASEAALVAGKDLRIEARSRVVVAQILPFGGIVLLLFAFALDTDRGVLPIVAPGLFWVAVMLSALLAVSRSFAVEAEHGARDGLRLSGLDGAAIFLGKAAALAAELLVLEVVLLIGVFVLYDVQVQGLVVIAPAALAATVAIAATGTVYGVLAAGIRVRETLVPLLVLPAVTPLLLAASRAFEYALEDDLAEAWRWTSLVAMIAAVSVMVGVLAFGPLLEES
jgi:heme exporter protein B